MPCNNSLINFKNLVRNIRKKTLLYEGTDLAEFGFPSHVIKSFLNLRVIKIIFISTDWEKTHFSLSQIKLWIINSIFRIIMSKHKIYLHSWMKQVKTILYFKKLIRKIQKTFDLKNQKKQINLTRFLRSSVYPFMNFYPLLNAFKLSS